MQLQKGTVIKAHFTSLTSFAQAHAKVEIEGESYNLVCPDLYPGDIAEVALTKIKKNFLESTLVKIIQESEFRVETKNNYFGISNATPLEALSYTKQLELKQNEVERILSNLDLLKSVDLQPIVAMQNPWYYRNKVEYSFGYDANFNKVLGFHVKNRRFDIVNADSCHLFLPKMGDYLKLASEIFYKYYSPYQFSCNQGHLRTLTFKRTKENSQLMMILEISGEVTPKDVSSLLIQLADQINQDYQNPISVYVLQTIVLKGRRTTKQYTHIQGPESIRETLNINQKQYIFDIFPDSFFQPNPEQASKIFELVQNLTNDLNPEVIYDLFCGTGTLGIVSANQNAKLFGMDIVDSSIQLANANANINYIKDFTFVANDVYKNLDQQKWPNPDLILVDPPRKGLEEKTIDFLASTSAKSLIYVSCKATISPASIR